MSRSLLKTGFEVLEAVTGSEALTTLKKADGTIDLVILDIRLPDIDGFEVCRRIKADPQTAAIPVLHLTASFISGQDKAHGLDGGADGYLIRPVEPVELIATVKALLRVRQAENDLRIARDEALAARAAAVHANRVKDEFLATLSHELRTPLTAIVGWASILQRGRASPAEQMEGLKTIERNAKAQTKLIEDLLDVSRIISGKLRLETQLIEIGAAVDAAIAVVRPTAEGKGQRLFVDRPASPLFIVGDPARLQQVISNLLGNATKFTPEDGTIRVKVQCAAAGLIELTIQDTGRGISPEFLPHIFERFRQADVSSRRGQGGLGLGLAIVRQLVELHGGSISAASAGEGRGATFTVRLPEAHGDSARAEIPATTSTSPPKNGNAPRPADEPLRGRMILVIEDDADCRSLAARVLEGAGATVAEVSSVAAAFEAIARTSFDAVVSDIGMPVEDGYDFIRRLRQLSSEGGGTTPALALSAFVQVESQRKMLANGFDAYLGKPVDPQRLCDAVIELVKNSRHAITPA